MFERDFVWMLGMGLVVCLWAAPAIAQSWDSQLVDGSRIKVDVTTNKATHYGPDGSVVPLWDGVHELEDGRTVTVRDGVMVPNLEVLNLRSEPRPEETRIQEGLAVCDKLVRKACGLGDECADAAGCGHAQSLREYAEQERDEADKPGYGTRFFAVPGQCRDGLANEALFPACNKGLSGGQPTPCGELVAQVCGDQQQCSASASCIMARELLEREYGERLDAGDGETPAPTSELCREAMSDQGVSRPCGR